MSRSPKLLGPQVLSLLERQPISSRGSKSDIQDLGGVDSPLRFLFCFVLVWGIELETLGLRDSRRNH